MKKEEFNDLLRRISQYMLSEVESRECAFVVIVATPANEVATISQPECNIKQLLRATLEVLDEREPDHEETQERKFDA